MEILIDIILKSGRSAVELALFVLLPVMVVMLSLMRLLEARGVLDWVVARLAPLLRPFGLTGLGVFAALQINFVSFAAPMATLTMMEQRGASDRHLAATLAMVFAMSQANAAFPMLTMGLNFSTTLVFSLVGGLVAAAATYYLFGRALSVEEERLDETLHHPVAESAKGVLDVINRAGAEAFKIAVGAMPMLVLSLVVVMALKRFGAIDLLTQWLTPLLAMAAIDPVLILPTLTKYLAGGTAMMGVMDDMRRSGQISAELLNASAGFLISPFDIPGVAVLISAGRRVAAVWKPAALGACVGIAARTAGHILAG
ncbi:nucleoside recognition domain-containing protein [Dechloromonas denitrificans]|uniref:nucleoside recognition domain-containing protein n=1 Tax=Dechloromonas denitrificans TaxID=281362 RepID=UPI001CF88B15|nr:nucleoside recognition domain-containing protein [Dechloromonas denitrificans]UCV04355.1 nucleoside recognition domain-containing protein [Dechloromonas denitrificans]UCV08683.1 nucleoside recognition domain-containing protein [Dechloromonas denitrificans]